MAQEGYLIAVDPDDSTVIAHWSFRRFKTEHQVARFKSEMEKSVGPRFVLIDTRDRPEWEGQIRSA